MLSESYHIVKCGFSTLPLSDFSAILPQKISTLAKGKFTPSG